MNDDRDRRTDAELEAMLRDLEAADLELIEPPSEVWEGIESVARAGEDDHGTVVSLGSRPRMRRRLAIGVAAAVVVVVAGLAAVLLTRDDSSEVVATASLAYDPENFDALGAQAQADADLSSTTDSTAS